MDKFYPEGIPVQGGASFQPPPGQTSSKAIVSIILGLASFLVCFITSLPGLVFGILALRDISRSQGQLQGNGLAITGIISSLLNLVCCGPLLIAYLLPAVESIKQQSYLARAQSDLRQISHGMLSYEATKGSLPPAGADAAGNKRLLSWRVYLLPYIDQGELYNQFKLDEPWDSPHNQALIDRMPEVYKPKGMKLGRGLTLYQVPTGNGALFQGEPLGPSMASVTDGIDSTALALEVVPENAVIWTKPDDWEFDPQAPSRGLGGRPGMRCPMVVLDGRVISIYIDETTPEELAAIFTRAGGEPSYWEDSQLPKWRR